MTQTSLDDPAVRQRLDRDGSYERIHGLPEQCLDAWERSRDLVLPPELRQCEKVLVLGMGGSAIAADFLQALAFAESTKPVTVVRGYDLPKWVDGGTLVIGCSHSGNTEETLSAFAQAMATPAKKLVITTGGRLRQLAEANGIPFLTYDYANVPRDAFGHGLVRLLAVAGGLGMVEVDDSRMQAAIEEMRRQRSGIEDAVPEADNAAKRTARGLVDLIPLTIGGGFMVPVARRWRTQINENADVFAFWDELPELDHNLVVGLRHPADLLRSIRPVFLDHAAINARTRLRYELTAAVFERASMGSERITFPQVDPLAAQLCAVHFGDHVSYYLAMLKGTRPMEIENIDWLKDELSKR